MVKRLCYIFSDPFNPITNISFDLPFNADVTLDIYNILGQKVETLLESSLEAGTHTVAWDASRYASGIYLYRIQAGDIVEPKR